MYRIHKNNAAAAMYMSENVTKQIYIMYRCIENM